MDTMKHTDTSRRNFLRTTLRWLAGGVLVGGLGRLVTRGGRPCDFQGTCGICPQVARCEDPRAAATRRELDRERAWQTNRKG